MGSGMTVLTAPGRAAKVGEPGAAAEIALVGQDADVPTGERVPAGGRFAANRR